jgi:hypothetical protein
MERPRPHFSNLRVLQLRPRFHAGSKGIVHMSFTREIDSASGGCSRCRRGETLGVPETQGAESRVLFRSLYRQSPTPPGIRSFIKIGHVKGSRLIIGPIDLRLEGGLDKLSTFWLLCTIAFCNTEHE